VWKPDPEGDSERSTWSVSLRVRSRKARPTIRTWPSDPNSRDQRDRFLRRSMKSCGREATGLWQPIYGARAPARPALLSAIGQGPTQLRHGQRQRAPDPQPRRHRATIARLVRSGAARVGHPHRPTTPSRRTPQASRPTPCPSPRRKFRRLALLRLTRCRIPGTCLTPPAEAGSCQSIQRKRAPIPSGKRADDRATTTA
jgi:hypothetical protein